MRTATIVIRDEVNIKIEGLELDARRSLVNAFKYDVPYARYLPAVRLGRWDGKVSYFQLGGSTYVNLLPEIIPILEKFNYDINLDDQREYSTTFDWRRTPDAGREGAHVTQHCISRRAAPCARAGAGPAPCRVLCALFQSSCA